MFVNKLPPSALDCHWAEGAGLPAPVELNAAILFRHTVASLGCVETVGETFTVIAALPEAVPAQRESETEVTV
jgi:hypothetical protein